MSESTTRQTLPEIEDVIREKLTGDARQNALDFFTSMRANGFSWEAFDLGHAAGWTPTYRGVGGGCIMIPGAGKQISLWVGLEWDFDDGASAEEAFKEAIWQHVVICPQSMCSPPYCQENAEHPGCKNRWAILGKEYESTCHAPLAFFDPDAKTYESLKRLLLTIK